MTLRLLPELWDKIFAEIDEEADLINVASTCFLFSSLVIPYHVQYRKICTGYALLHHVWAHLVRRSDLAKHMRQVRLSCTSPSAIKTQYPRTLIDDALDGAIEHRESAALERNLAKSLQYMSRLTVLVVDTEVLIFPCGEVLLQSIACLESLTELAIFGNYAKNIEPFLSEKIRWNLPNLKSLFLGGTPWAELQDKRKPDVLKHFSAVESLQVPDILLQVPSIRLPYLKTLQISTYMSQGNMGICDFLANHPSIEELWWFPAEQDHLILIPALPNLISLTGTIELFRAMENLYYIQTVLGTPIPPWKLRYLSAGLPVADLIGTYCIDRNALEGYHCIDFNHENLLQMAQIFPNLVWLTVSNFFAVEISLDNPGRTLEDPPFDDWLQILPAFQNLEKFCDMNYYVKLSLNNERLCHTILQLATQCPNLKEIKGNFCDFDSPWSPAIIDVVREPQESVSGIGFYTNLSGWLAANGQRISYVIKETPLDIVRYFSRDGSMP